MTNSTDQLYRMTDWIEHDGKSVPEFPKREKNEPYFFEIELRDGFRNSSSEPKTWVWMHGEEGSPPPSDILRYRYLAPVVEDPNEIKPGSKAMLGSKVVWFVGLDSDGLAVFSRDLEFPWSNRLGRVSVAYLTPYVAPRTVTIPEHWVAAKDGHEEDFTFVKLQAEDWERQGWTVEHFPAVTKTVEG